MSERDRVEYVTLKITTPAGTLASVINAPANKWDWATLLDCAPDEVSVLAYGEEG